MILICVLRVLQVFPCPLQRFCRLLFRPGIILLRPGILRLLLLRIQAPVLFYGSDLQLKLFDLQLFFLYLLLQILHIQIKKQRLLRHPVADICIDGPHPKPGKRGHRIFSALMNDSFRLHRMVDRHPSGRLYRHLREL